MTNEELGLPRTLTREECGFPPVEAYFTHYPFSADPYSVGTSPAERYTRLHQACLALNDALKNVILCDAGMDELVEWRKLL